MKSHDPAFEPQNEQTAKQTGQVAPSYVAPKIQKSQKLVEVTGQVASGFIPPPP